MSEDVSVRVVKTAEERDIVMAIRAAVYLGEEGGSLFETALDSVSSTGNNAIRTRSIKIRNAEVFVSLSDYEWNTLTYICEVEGLSPAELLANIEFEEQDASEAVSVFLLKYFRNRRQT
jgi:predicted DNA-binding ribbon-helix-helix protein